MLAPMVGALLSGYRKPFKGRCQEAMCRSARDGHGASGCICLLCWPCLRKHCPIPASPTSLPPDLSIPSLSLRLLPVPAVAFVCQTPASLSACTADSFLPVLALALSISLSSLSHCPPGCHNSGLPSLSMMALGLPLTEPRCPCKALSRCFPLCFTDLHPSSLFPACYSPVLTPPIP